VYGDSTVFCRGRFVSGPDARHCIASVVMICLPSVLWHIYVDRFLVERAGSFLVFCTTLLQLSSIGLLLATAFSDPGIVPRQEPFTEQYDASTKSFRIKQPPRYFDIVLRGHNFKLKYCTTCNIYRPPRCTHCSVCENCVERFDHHCPWIGNCVGKRNYRLFYSFVMTTGALNVVTLATASAQVGDTTSFRSSRLGESTGRALVAAMGEHPASVALAVYATALVWFTVGLCMYHTYLVATNQTTYEQVKGTYVDHNPFGQGVLRNFRDVLCSPVRPRYFDARTGSMRWPAVATKSNATMRTPQTIRTSDIKLNE